MNWASDSMGPTDSTGPTSTINNSNDSDDVFDYVIAVVAAMLVLGCLFYARYYHFSGSSDNVSPPVSTTLANIPMERLPSLVASAPVASAPVAGAGPAGEW